MVIPSTPGPPLLLRTRFHALSRFSRSHTSSINCSAKAGLSGAGFAINVGFLGFGVQGFTPTLRHQGLRQLLAQTFLPRSIHESPVLLVTLNRLGLQPSFPARPICFSAFRLWSASLALPTAWPNSPSADFCIRGQGALRHPQFRIGTRSRPPGVSSVAFRAQ